TRGGGRPRNLGRRLLDGRAPRRNGLQVGGSGMISLMTRELVRMCLLWDAVCRLLAEAWAGTSCRSARPGLEALEPRWMPDVNAFDATNHATTLWSDGRNWSERRPPIPSDDVK